LASRAVKKGGRSMIFCRTRRGVDRVGKELRQEDLNVAVIHGGLSQNQRDKAMERFVYGDCMALVATDVAARGIDVEGVQCVIHYDPPENGKAYKHRSGRTARAGAHGSVISFVQKPQKNEYNKVQRQVGIRVSFTSADFDKIPDAIPYTAPKRPKRIVSPLSRGGGRNRGRSRGGKSNSGGGRNNSGGYRGGKSNSGGGRNDSGGYRGGKSNSGGGKSKFSKGGNPKSFGSGKPKSSDGRRGGQKSNYQGGRKGNKRSSRKNGKK
ncbi:C-terminal helicase domain-containing protein, partial [Marine Group III euryarchaeote]|nr:C-terminal helicase domain-containing protein [Marine Group III euryarchaeote]